MKLSIKNIGKISSADIELNSITLIAGLNNTGKSTIGKILYCIFNGLYRIDEKARSYLKRRILKELETFSSPLFSLNTDSRIESVAEYLVTNRDKIKEISNIKEIVDKAKLDTLDEVNYESILRFLKLSKDEIYNSVLQSFFEAEFYDQIENFYAPENTSELSLKISDKTVNAEINDEKIFIKNELFGLDCEAIYIDDPFVFDNYMYQRFYRRSNHKIDLYRKLTTVIKSNDELDMAVDNLMTSKRLEEIYRKINSVTPGSIKQNNRLAYFDKDFNKNIDFRNISTGLKSFIIIKTLLSNGYLSDKGVLILDEPEVHLHPEWQKLFAEIIVLLQKEYNLHILINSHSPYFIDAIDVYSEKYGIKDSCKYYLSREKSNKSIEVIDTTANLEPIYELLTSPLQDLENERYSKN